MRAYLEFPEHSRGAVTSGRALNFFLDLCADVVMSHELWRSQLQDELQRTEDRLRQTKERFPGGVVLRDDERKELESLERERDEAKSRLSLLDNLQGKPLLGQEQLRHLRFQKGLVGPVLTIARDDVMPLTWPHALAVDPDFASARQVMEKAKQAALEELRAGSGLLPQAQSDLMAAADELRNAFDAARPRLLEESAGDAVRVQQYLDAKHFVQEARHGVYRLVAARELADVMPSESFAGQTVDQLMSYMARQGLRFAPADPNGDAAYETVFRLMADYYVGLHSLAMAVDQGDRKIAALDAEASRLTELRDRDTLAALKEVLEARPGRDAFERLSDVAETLAAIQETLFPLARALARNAEAAPFQPGDLVCEDCLGMREWRGEIVNIDGPNCWVNILYSRSKHHHVGQRYPFPKHRLRPCPKIGTIEVPRIYRLAHLPPLRSVPRPVPAVPIRPAPSHR